jgi:hypothetical protein
MIRSGQKKEMHMSALVKTKGDAIRQINDRCRQTFTGCMIVVTAAVAELEAELKARVLQRVRAFDKFGADNDPHHEHDMAFFDEGGERFFFKFDYYAPDMEHGSDDPANMEKTRRVLTIGFAADY